MESGRQSDIVVFQLAQYLSHATHAYLPNPNRVATRIMTTTLILIASGILIGAGIGVIWRDVQRTRRRAFVLQRDAHGATEPEVKIVILRGDGEPRSLARAIAEKAPAPPLANGHVEAPFSAEEATPSAHDTDLPLEQRWLVLKPTLAVAIGKVNAVLAPVRLSIGPAGEPTWSYKNAGYGAHRRMLLGEESLGWLRLELTADGRFHAALKAHKDEQAEINASAETVAASLSPVHASDVLSRCLEPAARYAARAGGGIVDERQLSAEAWKLVEPLVLAAINATNGALAQAGARLVPLQTASWQDESKRHRLTLGLEVNGSDVGRMLIERVAHEMEVAVGVADQRLIDLGRRKRIPVEGMTIHALAEVIASCAWPTIARFSESRSEAGR
jgi:hypothetical protein